MATFGEQRDRLGGYESVVISVICDFFSDKGGRITGNRCGTGVIFNLRYNWPECFKRTDDYRLIASINCLLLHFPFRVSLSAS